MTTKQKQPKKSKWERPVAPTSAKIDLDATSKSNIGVEEISRSSK